MVKLVLHQLELGTLKTIRKLQFKSSFSSALITDVLIFNVASRGRLARASVSKERLTFA